MTSVYIGKSVALDFYQSAKDRMAIFFQQLFARADCLVVLEQKVWEFRQNRASDMCNVLCIIATI
jgi:hypothetical protein